ncbi:MazG-like family protein [Streptomyces sp. NPDC017454]|uniref:MazG-like family protein n=1 Tax=unclassified Streptomyces TaxID=2593676 RepID=UPI003317B46F
MTADPLPFCDPIWTDGELDATTADDPRLRDLRGQGLTAIQLHTITDIPLATDHLTERNPMISNEQWATIRGLITWLDTENGRGDEEVALRILKLTEEAGEVAQAWIGFKGQNPRKRNGYTRPLPADVADELCDVIVTAAVALGSVVDDPEAHFNAKLAKIAARSQAAT